MPLLDMELIRHQTEFSWNPTQTDPGVTVTGVTSPGAEAVKCRLHSGVVGRSVGGAKSAEPVFYPDSSGVDSGG